MARQWQQGVHFCVWLKMAIVQNLNGHLDGQGGIWIFMFDSVLTTALAFVACLQIKHFVCDGPLQTLAMVKAKGFYGRKQGVIHALIHGAGTSVVLLLFAAPLALAGPLVVLDILLHYHIDYSKERLLRQQGWTVDDKYFWWSLTADQALHHLTYLLLALILFKP